LSRFSLDTVTDLPMDVPLSQNLMNAFHIELLYNLRTLPPDFAIKNAVLSVISSRF